MMIFFDYANQVFKPLSDWLVSDDLGGEFAGHVGPGLMWSEVVRLVGCTAKFSQMPLETASGWLCLGSSLIHAVCGGGNQVISDTCLPSFIRSCSVSLSLPAPGSSALFMPTCVSVLDQSFTLDPLIYCTGLTPASLACDVFHCNSDSPE